MEVNIAFLLRPIKFLMLEIFLDPDLVSGDGIYSRYLTNYPTAGRYEFSVTVDDNSKRAYYINDDLNRSRRRTKRAMPIVRGGNGVGLTWRKWGVVKRCCGSRVHVPQTQRQITGEFTRRQSGPAGPGPASCTSPAGP